jgi:hypothetical protein
LFVSGDATVTIIAPAVMSIAPSANAASADVFSLQGFGTMSPGLNVAVATRQNFGFSGSGTAIGTDGAPVNANCDAYGVDIIGAIELGYGNAVLDCTIGWRSITVPIEFVRVGMAMVISTGGIVQLGNGLCLLVDTSSPTITGYRVTCGAEYAPAR